MHCSGVLSAIMIIGKTSTTLSLQAFLQVLDIWWTSVNARVAIFEAKYTKVLENLESECDMALRQIDNRMYAKEYEDDYDQILCYGISFFKKRCMVKKK